MKKQSIETMSQYEVLYTGEELGQSDAIVFQSLCYLMQKQSNGNRITFFKKDLLSIMGKTNGGSNYEWLWSHIERLKSSVVHIKCDKYEYLGSLIHEVYREDDKVVLDMNEKLIALFEQDYSCIKISEKILLKSNLSKWLYDFYSSHKSPIKLSIDWIIKNSGSIMNKHEFKRNLKNAMDELSQTRKAGIINYKIENEFLVVAKSNEKAKEIDW